MARLDKKLTIKERNEIGRTFDTGRIYMAEVMDVRNISRAGDLLVYLIGSETDKNKSKNWIQASYAPMFYGTTPYDANSAPSYENDPQSFGTWFPMPCVGNYVFVFFPITSSENIACYWFACPMNPNTNYMLPGIPVNQNGEEKNPLCERNDKCNNTSNNKENSKTSTTENVTTGNIVEKPIEESTSSTNNTNEENTKKNDGSTSGTCTDNNRKQKELNEKLADAEKKQAVYKPISEALKRQGLDKDEERGLSTAGAKRESPSMCYGIKTPLGNTFVMDDGFRDDDNKTVWKWNPLKDESSEDGDINQIRKLVSNGGLSPWQREPGSAEDKRKNAGFRFRTRNGTQILIADEGTVFMINNDGSCWVEMTKNGFLEGYSKKGIAMSSDGDINLHTSKNIYMEAGETIAMRAKRINIESKGDMNIFGTPHINTKAVINCSEVNAEKGKINTFEANGGKMIGEMGGTFFGLCGGSKIPGYPESNLEKMPEIEPFKLKDPIEEEKNDIDGKGYSEEKQEKTENTINTKVCTHEPYCGHCKAITKNYKDEDEQTEEEKKENEENKNEENSSEEKKDENNNTQGTEEKNAKNNCGQTNNNCIGCNKSTGSCNKSAPVTSCTGCSGVTNQCCNKSSIPQKVTTNCPNKQLSNNFNLRQLCNSQTANSKGISNVPQNNVVEENLQAIAERILEPIRKHFGNVVINSGYRGSQLNSLIGGANNSQHLTGQAVDIEVPGISNYELAKWIRDNLPYDQLILENAGDLLNNPNSGWVHVSYNRNGNRGQLLSSLDGVVKSGLA